MVERVARDVTDPGRHRVTRHVGARHQIVDQHAAEGALVDESELRAVVAEAQPDVQVPLIWRRDRRDEELAAHPEVSDQALISLGRNT